MEQKQVIEGNKLIMEFLQLTKCTDKEHENNPCYWHESDGEYLTASQTKYHSSWDWLMPVVKKFDFLAEDKAIQFSEAYEYWCDKIDDAVTRTYEIEPIFKVLVEAIEWYNTQNKPK